uniref:Myb-like domain-containing protein n=1 Tax=Neogobius melanostomus TaxID=47308 RepID=A0A8C6UXV6_9GOBI
MRYLRLLAPPLQLLSATMWQVVQQGLVLHYGMLEEFVTTVTELVPELMSYNQRAQLILGLRARLVLELCRGEEPLDTNAIQNHLEKIKAPCTNKEVFPEYYGPKYDTALEMLVWEFITRLEELLPAPDFTQVAALLGDAPCLLEDCLQTFFAPDDMKAVVEHHRNLGFFEEKDSPKPSVVMDTKAVWSDDETLILLDVWGVNVVNPRPLKNPQLLAQISRKLSERGYSRTPEQCNSRIKRLRRDFNGTGKVECKFYDQVERILRADRDAPFSSSARAAWSESETLALIHIWGDDKNRGGHRGAQLFNIVSKKMAALGYIRTPDQCQTRMKRLKSRFRQNYDSNHFEELQDDDFSAYFSQDLDAMFNLQDERKKVTWSDKETVILLEIWGDSQVQENLQRYPQNTPVYSEIAEKLAACGYRRSTDQCHTRIKRLKALYRNRSTKAGFKFHNIMEKIMNSQPSTMSTQIYLVSFSQGESLSAERVQWSDEEVRTLIDIWAEEELTRSLGVDVQNGQIYSNISEKMTALGYSKSHIQCCLKLKELRDDFHQSYAKKKAGKKVEYRFYNQLEPIIGSLVEDLDEKYEETDNHQAPSTSQLQSEGRKATWSDQETRLLLKIWGEDRIQLTLKGATKTRHIYDYVSTALSENGFVRSADQCYTRIKRLKAGYHHEKYYKELDEILQKQLKADTSFDDVSFPELSLTDMSFPELAFLEDPDPNKVIWSDKETKVLLDIWASDEVQQNLKGSNKTKHIFEQISKAMLNQGYMRNADQCQSRIKRLRANFRSSLDNKKLREGVPQFRACYCKSFISFSFLMRSWTIQQTLARGSQRDSRWL